MHPPFQRLQREVWTSAGRTSACWLELAWTKLYRNQRKRLTKGCQNRSSRGLWVNLNLVAQHILSTTIIIIRFWTHFYGIISHVSTNHRPILIFRSRWVHAEFKLKCTMRLWFDKNKSAQIHYMCCKVQWVSLPPVNIALSLAPVNQGIQTNVPCSYFICLKQNGEQLQ